MVKLKLGSAEIEWSRLRDGAGMKRGEAGLGVSTVRVCVGGGGSSINTDPLISSNLWRE